MPNNEVPLIEAVFCQDIFAEGVASVERIAGECVRVTMYATAKDEHGKLIHVVVAKLVRPICSLMNRDSVMALVQKTEQAAALAMH